MPSGQVEALFLSHSADDKAVRPHPQSLLDEPPQSDLAGAFQVWLSGLHDDDVRERDFLLEDFLGDTVVIGQGNNAGPGAIAASNVQVVSSTKITATTGGGAQPGTWNLYVISRDGTSPYNPADTYTYQ